MRSILTHLNLKREGTFVTEESGKKEAPWRQGALLHCIALRLESEV